jgi:hypothetical protein
MARRAVRRGFTNVGGVGAGRADRVVLWWLKACRLPAGTSPARSASGPSTTPCPSGPFAWPQHRNLSEVLRAHWDSGKPPPSVCGVRRGFVTGGHGQASKISPQAGHRPGSARGRSIRKARTAISGWRIAPLGSSWARPGWVGQKDQPRGRASCPGRRMRRITVLPLAPRRMVTSSQIRRASRRPIPPSPGAGAAAGPGGQRPPW